MFQGNITEITLQYGFSLVNLMHTFKTSFPKNISGGLLLFVLPWISLVKNLRYRKTLKFQGLWCATSYFYYNEHLNLIIIVIMILSELHSESIKKSRMVLFAKKVNNGKLKVLNPLKALDVLLGSEYASAFHIAVLRQVLAYHCT